ncbi:hypothetical protein ABTN67_22270, partial [Acinetobacter baumannii]
MRRRNRFRRSARNAGRALVWRCGRACVAPFKLGGGLLYKTEQNRELFEVTKSSHYRYRTG